MNKIAKQLIAAASAGLLAVSLVACGGSSSSNSGSAPAETKSEATESTSAATGNDLGDYPNTSVSLIVGFNPGGDTDLSNRLMAQYVEKSLGQSIAVSNEGGSNGTVMLTAHANDAADGYSIFGVNTAALVSNFANGTSTLSYEDFEVVAVFGHAAGDVLYASTASGITSIDDLAKKASENPGNITMGYASGGTTNIYAALLQKGGIDVTLVDSGDGSSRAAALVGGHVDTCFIPYSTAKEYVENGDIIPIGTIGSRVSEISDVPSLAETPYCDSEMTSGYVWLAPKGTDSAIIEYLAGLVEDVCNDASFAEEQFPITYNDVVCYTGQDAIDFIADSQATAVANYEAFASAN